MWAFEAEADIRRQQDQHRRSLSRVEVGPTDKRLNARDPDLERGPSLVQNPDPPLDGIDDDDTAPRAPPATRSRMSESGGIADTGRRVRSTETRTVNQLKSWRRPPSESKTTLEKYPSIRLRQSRRAAADPRRSVTDPHALTATPVGSATATGTDRDLRNETAEKSPTSTMITI
jgi:hypothetical protein